MLKFINLQKLTAKTIIGILMIGGLVTPTGTKQAVASDGVQGLELRYAESAFQCGANDPRQADIKVEVYDKSNDGLVKTLSKGEVFTSSEYDSINDLDFVYKIYNFTHCGTAEGSTRSVKGSMLLGADDAVPSVAGFSGQSSVGQIHSNLDSYQELLLVELGSSNTSSSSYDLQDVVLVVDNNPQSLVQEEDTTDYDSDTITLTGTLRDFRGHRDISGSINPNGHEDFERKHNTDTNPSGQKFKYGLDTGITTNTLGADKKPIYAGGSFSTTNQTNFDQWYRDTPGVNQGMTYDIDLTKKSGSDIYSFNNNGEQFFPLDGLLYGNEGRNHNFHFTFEIHTEFTYKGGETFDFSGDDDVWVYINGQKVIDIGGVHGKTDASVSLDSLGLTVGETYDLDFFFAERHVTESNFQIETTLELETAPEPEPEPPIIPPTVGNEEDSDADNNGILDADEFARDGGKENADLDKDGIPNYQDLDDDGDNIADVMELYSPSDLDYSDTIEMTYVLQKGENKGKTRTVTLPNPPKDSDGNVINILDSDAIDTDGTEKPDYQDIDSDGDTIKDKNEAGDNKLNTAPFDKNNNGVPNYLDLDSDGDTISDKDEAGDNKLKTPPVNTDKNLTGGDNTPDYLDKDSDADNIFDKDEAGDSDLATSPVNSDGSDNPDYIDIDSDNDNISDKDEAGDDDTATSPVNTDKNLTGGDEIPDYLDLDSDADSLSDSIEAGDTDLDTSPRNSDNINDASHSSSTTPSGFPAYDDETPDFIDLDSDDNGILDADEVTGSSFDDDSIDNYRDLDDDNDGIADVIEIGADPSDPTESNDSTDDYQDDNSENDGWSDVVEGVTTNSGTGITTITITSPSGNSSTVNLKNSSGGSVTGSNSNTITITEGTNGTVNITGTPEGFDYQVGTYAD